MSLSLNIITSCIRPKNLQQIFTSIQEAKKMESRIDIIWHIVTDNRFDINESLIEDIVEQSASDLQILPYHSPPVLLTPNPFPRGGDGHNFVLDKIENGLVCFVDDDNIMHPNYLTKIYRVAKDRPSIGITYRQNMGRRPGKNYRIRNSHLIEPGRIDAAQATISRDLIGSTRWPPYRSFPPYVPDGDYISEIYNKHPGKFVILKDIISYYNYISEPDLVFD